jgi:hypothetical protein
MKRRIAATLIALACLLISNSAGAVLVNGWNFFRPYNCYGVQSGGVDYLYVVSISFDVLLTSDSTTITALAGPCETGHAFYVYLTGGVWNGVSVYPSIP